MPADVLGNRQFAAACLATLMMSAIFFSALVFLPQFMAKQLGYSAVGAGAGLLPMMGVFALTSFIAGPLYSRLGPKLIVGAGAALPRGRHLHAVADRRRRRRSATWCRAWWCSGSASACSTRR